MRLRERRLRVSTGSCKDPSPRLATSIKLYASEGCGFQEIFEFRSGKLGSERTARSTGGAGGGLIGCARCLGGEGYSVRETRRRSTMTNSRLVDRRME